VHLLSRSAQLLADGSVCDRPSACVSTGSYNFCRFAALGARAPLRQRAGPAPCVGSTAAEDAAADEAALRREGGAEYVDVDAFLAATPPDAPGGAADSGEEEEEQGSGREGGVAACVSALVALAGTDPAKAELWDLASGARACGCRWCVLQLTRLLAPLLLQPSARSGWARRRRRRAPSARGCSWRSACTRTPPPERSSSSAATRTAGASPFAQYKRKKQQQTGSA